MTTNFQRFDENALNILNDADYSSNTQRQNGVVAGLAQSSLHNKLFYQTSSMTSAIGQALSDLGYTVTDANYSGLVAALTAQLRGGFSKGYLSGKPVTYSSASSVVIPTGLKARSSDNTADMEVASNLTVSLASSGVNGLDAGGETANTWYYLYLIKNVSTGLTSGLFSTVNESVSGSITLPSGYTVKRQLPIAVRNDASSNIIPFFIDGGWPGTPVIRYNVDYGGQAVGATNVVNTGTPPTTFTDQSLTSYVPPISTIAHLTGFIGAAASTDIFIRTKGFTNNGAQMHIFTNGTAGQLTASVQTDSTQVVQYKASTSSFTNFIISVTGFTVTGVA